MYCTAVLCAVLAEITLSFFNAASERLGAAKVFSTVMHNLIVHETSGVDCNFKVIAYYYEIAINLFAFDDVDTVNHYNILGKH